MRRRLFILLLLVGLSPIGFVDRSASAQGTETVEEQLEACQQGGLVDVDSEGQPGHWWSAVCRPIPVLDASLAAPIEGSELLQPYVVKFAEEFGATNPSVNAEFMVVVVREGFFALDLRTDTQASVVVSSPSGQIESLRPLGAPGEVTPPPHYERTGEFIPCPFGCILDPAQPVLLAAGDVAIAKKGAKCLWCLLGTDAEKNGETGLLDVFVLLESGDPGSFSWIQDWETYQQGQQGRARDEQTTRAWAFSPPGSKCGGG
jgi:hypothetical protein